MPGRSARRDLRLAAGLQLAPTALRARDARPGRIRRRRHTSRRDRSMRPTTAGEGQGSVPRSKRLQWPHPELSSQPGQRQRQAVDITTCSPAQLPTDRPATVLDLLQPPNSHPGWTDEWGPVNPSAMLIESRGFKIYALALDGRRGFRARRQARAFLLDAPCVRIPRPNRRLYSQRALISKTAPPLDEPPP